MADDAMTETTDAPTPQDAAPGPGEVDEQASDTSAALQALEKLNQLRLDPEQTGFTPAQVAVMRVLNWDLSRLTPAHVTHFIYFCLAHDVDPFAGEVMPYVTEDGDVVPLIKIAGMRNRAAKTGEYRGTGKFEFLDENGDWHRDWVPATMGRPVACRVEVHRKDWVPTEATVYIEEVEVWETRTVGEGKNRHTVRRLTERWEIGEKGRGQLMTMAQKATEAAALRRGFPRELDGFYVREETERLRATRRADAAEEQRVEGEAKRAAARAADPDPQSPTRQTREEGVVEGVVMDRDETMRHVDRLRGAATVNAPQVPPRTVPVEEEPAHAEEGTTPVEEDVPVPLTADERAECLRAELEMQAVVLGVDRATLTARFEHTAVYGEPYDRWDDVMLLRVVARNRKQVTARLANDSTRPFTEVQAYGRLGSDDVIRPEDLPAR